MPLGIRTVTLIIFISTVISSCSEQQISTPAPIGEISVLEKLAESFRNTSELLSSAPRKLPPQERRKFVEVVFREAGYNYSATLISLGQAELDPFNEHQRDLMKLLFLPLEQLPRESYADIYTDTEISAINTIQKTFR